MTKVAIIIPFRNRGDEHRVRNLNLVTKHLSELMIGDIFTVGDGRLGNGPFNRSAAYNFGIRQAPKYDTYIFHEADMIIPGQQLEMAAELSMQSLGLVVPFDTYYYLSQQDTVKLQAKHYGEDISDPAFTIMCCSPEAKMYNGRSIGAVNVVSAQTMYQVGQWDEKFQGWGFDDRAMELAFKKATRVNTRFISGIGRHLWHVPGWSRESRFYGGSYEISIEDSIATLKNEDRYELYKTANSPEAIRLLTSGTI